MDTTDAPASAYRTRNFWAEENLRYVKPHFRLKKSAWLINEMVAGQSRNLLDVGCGPATLMRLLDPNIRYCGIDIAIRAPASNLMEFDFVENPIQFGNEKFDIVIAQGVFEYIGKVQLAKLQEIDRLLLPRGWFIVSYVNFDHREPVLYAPYNNVLPFSAFVNCVNQIFRVDRIIPTSHNWRHQEPTGPLMQRIHMHVNRVIPVISRRFAVEYFLICSSRKNGTFGGGDSYSALGLEGQ